MNGYDGLSHEENRVVNTFTRASPSVAYIQTVTTAGRRNMFELKGTEVPVGAGTGFLWDDQVSTLALYYEHEKCVFLILCIFLSILT